MSSLCLTVVYPYQFQPQFQRQLDVCLVPLPRGWLHLDTPRVCVCALRTVAEVNRTANCPSASARLSARLSPPHASPPRQITALHYGMWNVEWNQLHRRVRQWKAKKARQTSRMAATHNPTRTPIHSHSHSHSRRSRISDNLTCLMYSRCSRSAQPSAALNHRPPQFPLRPLATLSFLPRPGLFPFSLSVFLSPSVHTHTHACTNLHATCNMQPLVGPPLGRSNTYPHLVSPLPPAAASRFLNPPLFSSFPPPFVPF